MMTEQTAATNIGERFENELRAACAGLLYQSETDAPIEPIVAAEGTVDELIAAIREKGGGSIKRTSASDFFANSTIERNWHDAARKKSVKRFTKLKDLLEQNLNEMVCLRVGRVQIDIFVVGTDKAGRLIGIRTYAVET